MAEALASAFFLKVRLAGTIVPEAAILLQRDSVKLQQKYVWKNDVERART